MLPEAKNGLHQLIAPDIAACQVLRVPTERQLLPNENAFLIAEIVELLRFKQVTSAVEAKQIQMRNAAGLYEPCLPLRRKSKQIVRSQPASPLA